ncbi:MULTISPECIES: PHP domain-containing protein [unclassified Leifsonia]|uniref:PHP domain-containing protein n=1 Tax=unclassified Leifsonia TaxID=2663824 RepID=UPI0008A72B4D|nr:MULTISPECIES: PHP domain-containing protein [unclassified Leifsonia]SEH59245.1 putative hydrolase [Leifsonia sp. CL154]SFL19815.1 putative hydrolase [Leifsonia sp. CL147]
MDAVDALNEIAFWLERELAPSFKVQAFRRAAATIAPLDAAELATRVADGRLKRTKGIGDRTFQVIAQAVDGEVPGYLADLRERNAAPLDTGGAELLAQLKGDLHSHTEWSDGTTPIEVMAAAAATLGREYQAVTDHSPTLTVASGLSAERLEEQLETIAALDTGPLTLLTGIEVDILEDGTLDQTPGLLGRLDVVVGSVHSKLRADSRTMTERMLGGIRDPQTNILGHCTGRLVQGSRGTRPPSEFDAEAVFAACAENQVAVEINSRPERQDPPDELIRLALDAGCFFSIDTDAHAPGQLDFLAYGAARAAANGVPADRIITTWPLPRLRTFLAKS